MKSLCADRIPGVVWERIKLRLPGAQRDMLDSVRQNYDDLVEAFNLASVAADRMATALEEIERTPYGKYATKGDYSAFVRDIAHNARFPIGGAE